jgi:RNA polymerase sigma-70 factor (ECF subfamily)
LPSSDSQEVFLGRYFEVQDSLRAFVSSVIGDRAQADDVLQEVALVLWRQRDRFDPSRGPFGAWARGVVATEILRQRQRFARSRLVLDADAVEAFAAAWGKVESEDPRLKALEACVGQVPAPQRQALDLRYRDGLELSEVAHRLGRRTEAVGKALQRLRSALADCVRRRLARPGPLSNGQV